MTGGLVGDRGGSTITKGGEGTERDKPEEKGRCREEELTWDDLKLSDLVSPGSPNDMSPPDKVLLLGEREALCEVSLSSDEPVDA